MATTIIPVPTLSLDGWVKSTAEKADYIISHFFESQYSQTALYPGKVSSLQYLIQQNQSDMTKTSVSIREELKKLFTNYFGNATAEVTYKSETPNSSRVSLSIYVSFKDSNGKEFVLSKVVEIMNSKIQKIVTINNTGPAS